MWEGGGWKKGPQGLRQFEQLKGSGSMVVPWWFNGGSSGSSRRLTGLTPT